MDWLTLFAELWQRDRGKVIGVIFGLLFALGVISFGFFATLFIALCIFVGYFFGKQLDSHIGFKENCSGFFHRIFPKKDQDQD